MADIQLSLTLPQWSDPVIRKLLKETESFTAFPDAGDFQSWGSDNSRNTAVHLLFRTCTFCFYSIDLICTLILVCSTAFSAKGSFLAFVVACAILKLKSITRRSGNIQSKLRARQRQRWAFDKERKALLEAASSDAYRQELVLSDIKSFIRPKWDYLSKQLRELNGPLTNGRTDLIVHLLDGVWKLAPGVLRVHSSVVPC